MALFNFDLIVFSVLAFVYIKIKAIKPNLFYPPNNINIFLPPTEEDVKDIRREKEL